MAIRSIVTKDCNLVLLTGVYHIVVPLVAVLNETAPDPGRLEELEHQEWSLLYAGIRALDLF